MTAVRGTMQELAPAMSAARATALQQGVGGHSGSSSAFPSSLELAPKSINDQVFYRSREPHPDWIRELRRISPRSKVHGFLWLDWDPGEPWAPRQRWVIDEVLDPTVLVEYKGEWDFAVDPAIIEELEGPHPRSEGHMCHWDVPEQFQCLCRRKLGAWRGGPCQLITLRQWQLYQATGLFANPFWIIQGANGGHQASYNSLERRWLTQEGKNPEPPTIGSLPYAPFDARVTRQIIRHNRLLALDNNLSAYRQQQGAGYGQHKAEIEKEMRRQWVRFLEDQTREEAADFQDAYRKGEIDKGATDLDWDKVDAIATEQYIETGNVPRTRAFTNPNSPTFSGV